MKCSLLPLALCLPLAAHANPSTCERVKHQPNQIITVQSAPFLGTRIELPANLISEPSTSNEHLWDVDGITGTNQILLKPNSKEPEGQATTIRAFASNGQVYDIFARRADTKRNQTCVIVGPHGQLTQTDRDQISGFVLQQQRNASADASQIHALRQELKKTQQQTTQEKNRAVVEALKKYRYGIYTRYQWDEGKAFIGQNTVADVFDDGRFTYVRLAYPNKGILSVETVIGGKNAIAPSSYDEVYAMYQITGIYPRFTLRIDDVSIIVNRSDNRTNGAH